MSHFMDHSGFFENKFPEDIGYKSLKPHYRLVTIKDIQAMARVHHSAMASGPGIEYPFPLAQWTEEQAITIIHQARTIMDWNIAFVNNDFYHVDWR